MARPSKFNDKRMATIVTALKNGSTRKDAAIGAGVHYDTFNEWLKKGEAGEEGFSEFSVSVAKAESECANKMAKSITDAGKTDWRAAEAWLKRRRRDEWGDNVRIDVDDEITRLLALMAAGSKAKT